MVPVKESEEHLLDNVDHFQKDHWRQKLNLKHQTVHQDFTEICFIIIKIKYYCISTTYYVRITGNFKLQQFGLTKTKT